MPQFDPTSFLPQLVWLAISFVVLYLLMVRVALPRVADVLEERSKRREDDLARAESLEQEAEAVSQAYEETLATARNDAHGSITRAAEAAKGRAEARLAEVNARLDDKVAREEAEIAAARAAALGEATRIAAETARLAAAKIAGLDVDQASAQAAAEAAMKGSAR